MLVVVVLVVGSPWLNFLDIFITLQEHFVHEFRHGRFSFVRTTRPDHCSTTQFENEIGFFREFLLKAISLVHTI